MEVKGWVLPDNQWFMSCLLPVREDRIDREKYCTNEFDDLLNSSESILEHNE